MEKEELDQVKKIGQKYDLDFILLYGSQAKGKSVTKESDFELAIYRRDDIVPEDYFGIYLELNKVFAGQNLDLKTLAGTDTLLRFQIIKDGIPLYIKDQTLYHEFYAFAYKDFHDSQSLFNLAKLMQEKRQEYLERQYAW